MRILSGLTEVSNELSGAAIAIGNFDGAHLGHQALFDRARAAVPAGAPLVALTFEPHPARVLQPDLCPPLIATRARKRELLSACGLTHLIEQAFDRAFAALPAQEFVARLAAVNPACVVVGNNFTYGRGRQGSVEALRAGLAERGVRLEVVEAVTLDGLVVSSTKIRELVLEGRMEGAARLLGRDFDLDGEVVRGAARGRTLGFPTANLKTAAELLPALGVYAVRARLLDPAMPFEAGARLPAPLLGAANLGVNPTFRAQAGAGASGPTPAPLLLEVHLLDFEGDLYGRCMRVEFHRRIREERRFPGPEALRAQIADDVATARRFLAL